MATSDVERGLDDWAAAWLAHDMERILSLFTNDCVYEDVTFGVVKHGKAELRAFADGTFAVVPDFTVELLSRFAADTGEGLEWVISGTHHGNFPGLPATSKRFSAVRGATIVEPQEGKVRRNSDCWDAATCMRQGGLLPAK